MERDNAPSPAGGAQLAAGGVLHPVPRDGITETNLGTREFATVDADGSDLELVDVFARQSWIISEAAMEVS